MNDHLFPVLTAHFVSFFKIFFPLVFTSLCCINCVCGVGNLAILGHGFSLYSNGFCGNAPNEVTAMSSQVSYGFDITTGSDNLGVSCCIVEAIDCTPSPTSSPPTPLPTNKPTPLPTLKPTPAPSQPTTIPSPSPTMVPTLTPTFSPSLRPTLQPSPYRPAPTYAPIFNPTQLPYPLPTTPSPTFQPTEWIEKDLNTAGVVIGGVGLVLLVLIMVYYWRKEKRKQEYMSQVKLICFVPITLRLYL